MKLGVVLPTRGMVFTKTIMQLYDNLSRFDGEWQIFTDMLPLPNCFNIPVQRALDWGAEAIWMVEEDNELPPDNLKNLLASKEAVSAYDYPVGTTTPMANVCPVQDGVVTFCATGNTLIRREVFETLKSRGEPYFRTGVAYSWPDMVEISGAKATNETWARHDVDFGMRINKLGYKIEVVGKAGQYKMKHWGERDKNSGLHVIETWRLKDGDTLGFRVDKA